MKKIVILLIFSVALTAIGQQRKTTFFKDFQLKKEVAEKKAKYKRIDILDKEVFLNVKVFNIRKNCLVKEENYFNNKPTGKWTTHTKDCKFLSEKDFTDLVYSDDRIDTLFNNILKERHIDNYEMAIFGKGESDIFKYIETNIHYPSEAIQEGASGIVYLQFIIKANGKVESVSVIRSVNVFLDFESLSMIKKMPNWMPAKKDGKPIDSCFFLPIKFTLK
jgi:TonB family protein